MCIAMDRREIIHKGYLRTELGRMSIRAAAAYDRHEMPEVFWSKEALIEEIKRQCNLAEIEFPEAVLEMKKGEIFAAVCVPSGWHHTGKKCKRTVFYRVHFGRILSTFFPPAVVIRCFPA